MACAKSKLSTVDLKRIEKVFAANTALHDAMDAAKEADQEIPSKVIAAVRNLRKAIGSLEKIVEGQNEEEHRFKDKKAKNARKAKEDD